MPPVTRREAIAPEPLARIRRFSVIATRTPRAPLPLPAP